MKHFDSHDDQQWADLVYGSQREGCLRLTSAGPPAADLWTWDGSRSLAWPGSDRDRTAERCDEMDAVDLESRFPR